MLRELWHDLDHGVDLTAWHILLDVVLIWSYVRQHLQKYVQPSLCSQMSSFLEVFSQKANQNPMVATMLISVQAERK